MSFGARVARTLVGRDGTLCTSLQWFFQPPDSLFDFAASLQHRILPRIRAFFFLLLGLPSRYHSFRILGVLLALSLHPFFTIFPISPFRALVRSFLRVYKSLAVFFSVVNDAFGARVHDVVINEVSEAEYFCHSD